MAVYKFKNIWGETGWMADADNGTRIGFFAKKQWAVEAYKKYNKV